MAKPSERSFPTATTVLIILVVLAGFIPAFYINSGGDESKTLTLERNNITTIDSHLTISFENTSGPSIRVDMTDVTTGEAQSQTLDSPGGMTNFSFDNGNVSVYYTRYISESRVTLMVGTPVTYGWSNTQIAFLGSIGLLIIALFTYIIFTLLREEDS